MDSVGSDVGPDIFGFYSRGIAELLSEDDDLTGPGEVAEKDSETHHGANGCSASGSLFDDKLASDVSYGRRERLRSFLRRSVFDLSAEVDKMIEKVLKMLQLQEQLRSRKQKLPCSAVSSDGDIGARPHKKTKISSSSSSTSVSANEGPIQVQSSEDVPGPPGETINSKFSRMDLSQKEKVTASEMMFPTSENADMPKSPLNNIESRSEGTTKPPLGSSTAANKDDGRVEDDLQFLLKSDSSLVEKILKKYNDELSCNLEYMGKQLETLLDSVMSKRRSMTRAEKQELQKLIQMLPQDNLGQVVGILGRSSSSNSKIYIDLEKEDNVTLWRLYNYVQAFHSAKRLSSIQGSEL